MYTFFAFLYAISSTNFVATKWKQKTKQLLFVVFDLMERIQQSRQNKKHLSFWIEERVKLNKINKVS
jgi:hypothetical protein